MISFSTAVRYGLDDQEAHVYPLKTAQNGSEAYQRPSPLLNGSRWLYQLD